MDHCFFFPSQQARAKLEREFTVLERELREARGQAAARPDALYRRVKQLEDHVEESRKRADLATAQLESAREEVRLRDERIQVLHAQIERLLMDKSL
jgi:chromosome segregation ATPase